MLEEASSESSVWLQRRRDRHPRGLETRSGRVETGARHRSHREVQILRGPLALEHADTAHDESFYVGTVPWITGSVGRLASRRV